jgi:hypothetical protein
MCEMYKIILYGIILMGIILVCDYGGRLQVINDNDFSHNLPHILLSICKVSMFKGKYNVPLKWFR